MNKLLISMAVSSLAFAIGCVDNKTLWYADTDGDGQGDPSTEISSVESPGPSYVENDTDCDDDDASRFAGNPEVCDGVDNDCDSIVPVGEADDDNDNYLVCSGFVSSSDVAVLGGDDCDDGDPSVYEGCSESDLAIYLPFSGNANDESGNGLDGTAYNNFEYVQGVDGQGIRLVGSGHTGYGGGHVLLPFIALNEIPVFTISMWVNHEGSTSSHGEYFISYGQYTGGNTVGIGYTSNFPDCSLRFNIGGSGTTGIVDLPYTSDLVNNWNHMVLRADNGTMTAFLNGQSIGSDSYQLGEMQPTAGLGVHWFNSGGTESTRFIGSIDEVRIYEKALSDAEVQALYNF